MNVMCDVSVLWNPTWHSKCKNFRQFHVSGQLNLKLFTLIKKPTKEESLQCNRVVFRLVKGGAKQCKSPKTNRKEENGKTWFAEETGETVMLCEMHRRVSRLPGSTSHFTTSCFVGVTKVQSLRVIDSTFGATSPVTCFLNLIPACRSASPCFKMQDLIEIIC